MPILNIRDMGLAGINSDMAPWELPPSALSSGVNFRMSNGKIQSAGGVEPIGQAISDKAGHVTPTKPYAGESSWILCGSSSISYWDGDDWVSKKGSLSFTGLNESLWSSCSIGNVTFLNHPDFHPIYWTNEGDGTGDFKILPWKSGTQDTWASKKKSCQVLCAHNNFLMALGIRDDQEYYRDRVWWSHPVEPNGIPPYWDITADQPDSIAGYVSLGRGGKIIGGESLRDSFVVYSQDAINVLDFVGDALGWRRRAVSTSADLIGKEGVVEVKGQHYFIGRDDIMTFDGNSMQSVIHNRLRTRLASDVNEKARDTCWAAHYETYNEVWFAVPSAEAEYPDVAYAYNYRDNTWGVRSLGREVRHGNFGPEPTKAGTLPTWDSITSNWDDERGSWSMAGGSPFASSLVGAAESRVYNLDPSVATYSDDTVAYDTFLQRVDIPVGGHETNTTITRVYPLIHGTSPVQIRLGSAQRAGGPVRWAGDFVTFTPGVDRKIDVRTTGETHAYEIRSSGTEFFDMTGMDIEFAMAGRR